MTIRKQSPGAPARAFTLIELLVATAIFSVLLSALFSILFGVLKLRQTAWNSLEAGIPREQIAMVIQRDLTNLAPPNGTLAGSFEGTAASHGVQHEDTMTFYTTTGVTTGSAPWGDLQNVNYLLETPTDRDESLGMDLMRKVYRNLLATSAKEPTDTSPWRLARGIKSFQVLYWNSTSQAWTDTWDSTANENANPAAIKVRIEFVKADKVDKNEHIEPPLELACEIAPQPRTAASK